MNDPNAYGFSGGEPMSPGPVQPQYPPAMGGYKFSSDELRVLSECNNESFYKRSLPIGTMLGLGTFGAMQRGMLRPNPRFGALPKVTLAVVVGYFAGKISYQEACAQKLMALPGSYVGQLLREKKEGRGMSTMRPGSPMAPPTMFGAGAADIYSDAGPGSSLNLDTDRPLFNDDAHIPTNEHTGRGVALSPDGAGAAPGSALSYDELRRRNRGEYTEARQDPYRTDPNVIPPITRGRPTPPPASAPANTNKYGDTME